MNYLLTPQVIANISNHIHYANPNLTPTSEALKSLYVVQPLPQKMERVRTRVWTSIKSDK